MKPTKEKGRIASENPKKETPVLLCVETLGNVIIDRKVLHFENGIQKDYIYGRIKMYEEEGFIPDSKISMLYCADPKLLPGDHVTDFPGYLQNDMAGWGYDEEFALYVDHPTRLVAFCKTEGLVPTVTNMAAMSETSGYKEFCRKQDDIQWECQEREIAGLPAEQRYDDWSFVFETTGRKFTDEEKKDIQVLGSIMSTGYPMDYMTPRRFPSLGDLQGQINHLNILTYGSVSIGSRDIPNQLKAIKQKAADIAAAKYPEIAQTMREKSGMPSGTPGNEVFALVSHNGEVVDLSTNKSGKTGFLEYMSWKVQGQSDRVAAMDEGYEFVRYRFDDKSLMPAPGLSEGEMWRQITQNARESGIKPMDVVSFTDAEYCLTNKRNPLHPDNSREKLIKETAYGEHIRNLWPAVEKRRDARRERERTEEPANMRCNNKKTERRIRPKAPPPPKRKKGRGL